MLQKSKRRKNHKNDGVRIQGRVFVDGVCVMKAHNESLENVEKILRVKYG